MDVIGKRDMIGRLNHVAIAVKDLEASTALYRDTLGARVSQPQPEPEHGVTVVFVELPNTKIELLEPLGTDSPIAKFLERNIGSRVANMVGTVGRRNGVETGWCWAPAKATIAHC